MTKYFHNNEQQIEISQILLFQAVILTVALQALFAQECLFVEHSECHRQNNNNNPHFVHSPQ